MARKNSSEVLATTERYIVLAKCISLLGRGSRFFLEAIIIIFYGEQIMSFILNYFEVAMLIIAAVVISFYIFYIKLLNSS